jgi:hypothetical protein
MAKTLTPRGRALRWMTNHRGITEQPPGSNSDRRKDGITAAQKRIGTPVGGAWCGTWCANAALAGGVKIAAPWRWAAVAFIEDDARAKRNGFRGWIVNPRSKAILRGDLVVLFGHGVHVEMVRRVFPRLGLVLTDGGNTSPGKSGSQANGGGSYRRWRRFKDCHGFALVDYPNR